MKRIAAKPAESVVPFQHDNKTTDVVLNEMVFWLFCMCWVHIVLKQRHFTKHVWIRMLCIHQPHHQSGWPVARPSAGGTFSDTAP